MNEYKITRQTVEDKDKWTAVPGTSTRELDLYPPEGTDWTLHSFEHGPNEIVAVWSRRKHAMSEIYSHSEGEAPTVGAQPPVKTIEDMPTPE